MQGWSKKGGVNSVSCVVTLAHLLLKKDICIFRDTGWMGALGGFQSGSWTFQHGGSDGYEHRVHTEWHWHLSGVHSIMMVNSAQPGKGGVSMPSPFHTIPSQTKLCTLQLKRQIHSPYFSSTPICTLGLCYVALPSCGAWRTTGLFTIHEQSIDDLTA